MKNTENAKKTKILYLDNDQSHINTFVKNFNKTYDLLIVQSTNQALKLLSTESSIKVIIIGDIIHDKDSIEFLNIIAQEHSNPIRMVISDHNRINELSEAINKGHVYKYICKKIDDTELKAILIDAIKIFDLEENNRHVYAQLNNEIERKQEILNIFEKYVPNNVLQTLLQDNNDGVVASQVKNLVVLFVDIRQSMLLIESLDPPNIIRILNSFFNLMNECLTEHSGNINKFLGDGVLAIFGAPIRSINDTNNALSCAIKMLYALQLFNKKWKKILPQELKIGIGIHSGDTIVGSIGSDEHLEYGVLGDTVNIASRLEELTHNTPNSIIFSQSIYNGLTKHLQQSASFFGDTKVRGKEESIHCYIITEENIQNLYD